MKKYLNNYNLHKKAATAGLALLLLSAASCTKDFEKINAPYKDVSVATASAPALFNQLSRNMTQEDYTLHNVILLDKVNQLGVQNVNTPYTNYIASYWSTYYQNLADYKFILKLIDESGDPQIFTNLRSISTILMSLKTMDMLDRYGDIPYFNAAVAQDGVAYYRPEYDDQAAIYKSVLEDLTAAVNAIRTGSSASTQLPLGNYESFLASNYDAWIKFGNAIRLRYAVRLFAKDPAIATPIITDIIGGNKPLPNAVTYASTTAMRENNYGNYPRIVVPTPNYADRRWYTFREVSVSNIRLSTNVWTQISNSNADDGSGIFDPRAYVWFMPNNAGKWVPQPQDHSVDEGSSTLYRNDATPAPANSLADNKFAGFNFYLVRDFLDMPFVLISEADVHFLKAEIYAKGMGVAKDFTKANQEYQDGLRSSVNFWYTYVANSASGIWPASKPTLGATAIATFLANPKVALVPGDDAGNVRKIITQAWLASIWNQPEAWAISRRTGLTPKAAGYNPQVFNKLPYPENEKQNNFDNWMKASGGAEPDAQATVKVYWAP
ncbi:SusD/RagB family nutrient-binding outer membrane lipoprotein [Niabella insulamsoli]|uniref:SusD/RagB family nutrient-binding outer membrane lipoprotein n=1 Tax=Niabella insulamsoli TaxID=3144874 RepID=UPI0031FBFE75